MSRIRRNDDHMQIREMLRHCDGGSGCSGGFAYSSLAAKDEDSTRAELKFQRAPFERLCLSRLPGPLICARQRGDTAGVTPVKSAERAQEVQATDFGGKEGHRGQPEFAEPAFQVVDNGRLR